MRYKLKNIDHRYFFEQLNLFKEEIIGMLNIEEFNSKEESDRIINNVKTYINKHIEPDTDEIINLLDYGYSDFDDYYSPTFGIDNRSQKEKARLSRFKRSLFIMINYLSNIDSLLDSKETPHIETITEKSDYLLSKLHTLYGDGMYSASTLFQLNDIRLRDNEGREIAENLRDRGYVVLQSQYGPSDMAKISVKGAAYIERKNKVKSKVYDNGLNKRIDDIIERLVNLGYGQEIIFNEIQELRELQHKLSKKSWKQLLKGKLIDLTLDKLINIDTASSIYEYLTNSSLKLLK